MTEDEARALPIGAPIRDNGPGVGTITEKHIDFFSIQWTAPPERTEGVSTFLYEDCELLSSGGATSLTMFGDATPATLDSADTQAYTLGTVFKSSVAGEVVGARFYKAVGNTGVHVAALYDMTPTMMGQATFAGESASGWQEVMFGTPIAIPANVNHVIAVSYPVGHYSADTNYFATDRTSGPLTALASASVPPGNARYIEVFANPSTPQFPNLSVNSSNYWVDVLFRPT